MLTCEDVLRREFKKLLDNKVFLNIQGVFDLNFFHFKFENEHLDLLEGLVKRSLISDPLLVQLCKTDKLNSQAPEYGFVTDALFQLVTLDLYAASIAGKVILNMHTQSVIS